MRNDLFSSRDSVDRAAEGIATAIASVLFFIILKILFLPLDAEAATNLVPNPSLELQGAANPTDWSRGRWGTNTAVFTYPTPGHAGTKAAKVALTSRVSGDAKWYFSDVSVTAGTTYHFSDFYKSNVPSFVTVRYGKSDGTFIYKDIANPPAVSDWTQSSADFTPPAGVVSATVFHLINQVGELTIDDSVITADEPPPPSGDNLIANPSFESQSASKPSGWHTDTWETNTAVFTYPTAGHTGARAAKVSITNWTSGDSKWYHDEASVSPGATYHFSDFYKSNVPSILTAEWRLSNGSFSYQFLTILSASSNWSESSVNMTAPATAVAVTLFHVIDRVGELTVDDYALRREEAPPSGVRGLLTFTFDDGPKKMFQNAIPILNAAAIKSTQFVITGRFGNTSYVNEDDVRSMHADGHEIGAHTRTHAHLTALSASEARTEIEGSRDDLAALGIGVPISFAYPFGEFNNSVKQMVVDAGFSSARATLSGLNDPSGAIDSYALKRRGVNADISAATVRSWIDEAMVKDDWLVLAFHLVEDGSDDFFSTTPSILQSIVDYAVSTGIRTSTQREAVDLLGL